MYEAGTAATGASIGPDAPYEGPPFRDGDLESVAHWFAAGWHDPGSAERFCAHFLPGCAEDVRLVQPGTREVRGHAGFRRLFGGLFALMPDIHADVHSWAPSGDSLYIEFTLSGTLGRRPVRLRAVDRLTLEDGLVAERTSFFDPAPLFAALGRHPPSWPRAVRLLAGNLRRR